MEKSLCGLTFGEQARDTKTDECRGVRSCYFYASNEMVYLLQNACNCTIVVIKFPEDGNMFTGILITMQFTHSDQTWSGDSLVLLACKQILTPKFSEHLAHNHHYTDPQFITALSLRLQCRPSARACSFLFILLVPVR